MNEVGKWVLEEFTPCGLPKEVAASQALPVEGGEFRLLSVESIKIGL